MSTYDVGEITVYIVADTAGFDRGISRTRDTMNSFQRSMQIAAGVLMRDLFYGFVGAIREATELGAQVQTLKNSFEAFTDAAGAQYLTLERLRAATQGMVSDVDLLTQTNRMLAAGLPVDEVEALFSGAIKLGKAMGIDASMAIEKLTLGLVRMSWRLMDDLGIIMRASTANEEYAKSIGVVTSSLNADQKQTAWIIYGTKELTERVKILGDNIGEADKMIDQFSASMENLYTAIGENLAALPVVTTMINALAPVVGIMLAYQFMNMSNAAMIAGKSLIGLQAVLAMGAAVGPWIAIGIAIALLPTAVRGYGMALHDLRMATDDMYRSQQELNAAYDVYIDTVQKSDAAINTYLAAQSAVQDAQRGLVSAADAYNDALDRQMQLEDDVEEAQRAKAVAYANFVAALNYAKGVTDSYREAQDNMTWSTREAEMVYLSLRDTLWGLEDQYKSLSDAMRLLNEENDVNTLAMMEVNLQIDKLQYAYDRGNVNQRTYERSMKRLRLELARLRIENEKNSIEQFKLTQEMDDAKDGIDETTDMIDTLVDKDDELEGATEDLISDQNQLTEAVQDTGAAFIAAQTAVDTFKNSQVALATAFEAQWVALQQEVFWLTQVNKEEQQLHDDRIRRDEERRKREEEARPNDDTTPRLPNLPDPSVPNIEPTGTQGGAATGGTVFSPSTATTTLQVNIGTVVGTDKATAEKTGEMVIDYVVRGLRTRGVVAR